MYSEEGDSERGQTFCKSPEKSNFSLATRKYLAKHQLVSPPTKEGGARKRKEKRDKVIIKNGKILGQLPNGNDSDPESIDLQRLQLK